MLELGLAGLRAFQVETNLGIKARAQELAVCIEKINNPCHL